MSLPVSHDNSSTIVDDTTTEEGQYLTFYLTGEMFAINILHIREILEYSSVTTVPMMPDYVRGVINLRGAVVPIVDLSARFGNDKCQVTKRTCIVIIEVTSEETEVQEIGVVVDSVSEVLEIPDTDIEPAPDFGAKIRADFIAGMGKVEERFVIIIDVNRVLSVDELSQLSQIKNENG